MWFTISRSSCFDGKYFVPFEENQSKEILENC